MLAGSKRCIRCGSGRNRRLHGTRYMTASLIQLCVALYDAMHNCLGVLQLALGPKLDVVGCPNGCASPSQLQQAEIYG